MVVVVPGRRLIVPGTVRVRFSEHPAQLAHETIQHPSIPDAQYEQDGGAHARPDDAADVLEAVEAVAQSARRRRDDYARDDDDGRVPETEKRPHRHRPLARRDQSPRHQVDGRDVVCV